MAQSGTTPRAERAPASRLLFWLTVLHIVRVPIGGSSFSMAMWGDGPPVFLISGAGDFLIGLFVPAVAFALARRRGYAVWAAALVWNALGLADIINGQLLARLSPDAALLTLPPLIYLIPASLSVAHIVSIILLTRPPVTGYYLCR